jgi:hypothetical protein
MGRFLKRLILLALLAAAARKVNDLMTIQRTAPTPELPQA